MESSNEQKNPMEISYGNPWLQMFNIKDVNETLYFQVSVGMCKQKPYAKYNRTTYVLNRWVIKYVYTNVQSAMHLSDRKATVSWP